MSAPVTPVPAATLVLLRDGHDGLEVLLLRRSPQAGFAPGAYVFPGGIVDADDADPLVLGCLDGITAERARARLEPPTADPPPLAYYAAAVREAFEEAGILLGVGTREDAAHLRRELLEARLTFGEVLTRIGCRLAAGEMVYFAHWITPERSPRRFDTRFFAARVADHALVVVDEREMTDALWMTPSHALREHVGGRLPMMLPTIKTLERLSSFPDTTSALADLAEGPVPTVLPGAEVGGFAGPVPQARLPTS